MIKFADLRVTGTAELNVVRDVLLSGKFVRGVHAQEFGEKLAHRCNAKYGVSVSSGNAALYSALRFVANAHGRMFHVSPIKVLVPALSFASTLHAVTELGLTPVFCDVLPNGLLDQAKAVSLVREQNIKILLYVHLYGQHGKICKELLDICDVIEDSAQTIPIPAVQGVAACFSFYPSKNLGSVGDAGAVVTNESSLFREISSYIDYGRSEGKHHPTHYLGNNLRMSEIGAAVLLYRLEHKLQLNNDRRCLIAKRMVNEGLHPITENSERNVWHLFPMVVDDPYIFSVLLEEEEIETGEHYPYTLPQLYYGTIYDYNSNGEGGLPNLPRDPTEYPNAYFIATHELSLPVGPHIIPGEALKIVGAMQKLATYDAEGKMWRLK